VTSENARPLGSRQHSGREFGVAVAYREVLALVGAGDQFSCIPEDIADFDFHRGETCFFKPISVLCSLADGFVL
jgi:hypothetical protein